MTENLPSPFSMFDAEMEHKNRISFTPLVDAVVGFMQIGGQSTHRFNPQQAALYMGLQLEELAEKCEVLALAAVEQHERDIMDNMRSYLTLMSGLFKAGQFMGCFTRADHDKLIDADFDTAWVSIGAVVSTASLPEEAIAHGTYTNLAKFPEGKCERDANGKIQKPADWAPPDFTPFVDPAFKKD